MKLWIDIISPVKNTAISDIRQVVNKDSRLKRDDEGKVNSAESSRETMGDELRETNRLIGLIIRWKMCYMPNGLRTLPPPATRERKEKRQGRRRGTERVSARVGRQLFRIQYVRMAATSDWLLSSRANEGAWSRPVERCAELGTILISVVDDRHKHTLHNYCRTDSR